MELLRLSSGSRASRVLQPSATCPEPSRSKVGREDPKMHAGSHDGEKKKKTQAEQKGGEVDVPEELRPVYLAARIARAKMLTRMGTTKDEMIQFMVKALKVSGVCPSIPSAFFARVLQLVSKHFSAVCTLPGHHRPAAGGVSESDQVHAFFGLGPVYTRVFNFTAAFLVSARMQKDEVSMKPQNRSKPGSIAGAVV